MTLTISFLGAARSVTGSRHLVEADGVRVLIDCGLYQERQNSARNWLPFAVPPASIEATVLTHAHIDHSGFLPRLVRLGYRGLIYCSAATADVVPLVLADAARLQAEDAAFKRKRHAAEGRQSAYPEEALYDEDDVEATVHSLRGTEFGTTVTVAPGFRATLFPSGHILGASMVLLEHEPTGKRILFSGDLGRPGRPLMPDPTDPPRANLTVIESTYGDRLHDNQVDVSDQLQAVVSQTIQRGGSVLIPCFAVERAQELLYHLQALYREGRTPRVPVFLDSPMAIKLLRVYGHHPEALDDESRIRMDQGDSPFAIPELRLCASREESKYINEVDRPSIIIAGSGMCTGGRIKHHLARHLDRCESTLLFVGYQASGTLGRQLLDGAQEVRLFGRYQSVACRIEQIHGLSGHADREELLAWLSRMPGGPKQVSVVHGGTQVTASFAEQVRERFGCTVMVPEYGDQVTVH